MPEFKNIVGFNLERGKIVLANKEGRRFDIPFEAISEAEFDTKKIKIFEFHRFPYRGMEGLEFDYEIPLSTCNISERKLKCEKSD